LLYREIKQKKETYIKNIWDKDSHCSGVAGQRNVSIGSGFTATPQQVNGDHSPGQGHGMAALLLLSFMFQTLFLGPEK
jgi:hypothetical protein